MAAVFNAQQQLQMLAQDFSVGKIAEFLHEHGEEVIVTDEIAKLAATQFQAEETISFLLRYRGADFKITEETVSTIIKESIQGLRKERPYDEQDDSIYAGEVLSLLLWERPDEVQFTESMLKDIPLSRNGSDIMYTILTQRPSALPRMDDEAFNLFAPAIDAETMRLLLDVRGDEIVITEDVLLSLMAGSPDLRNVLKVLLDRRYDEVVITNEMWEQLRMPRKHQGGPSKISATMAMLLRRYEDKVDVTETLALQAAKYCRPGVMDILVTKRPEKVEVTEELLTEAARNECSNGELVTQVLLRKGRGDKTITEKICVQAASNSKCGNKLLSYLLGQAPSDFRFTEEGMVNLMRNLDPTNKSYHFQIGPLLDAIFNRYQGPITERIVEAAVEGLWCRQIMPWLMHKRGQDFRVTPKALELAAQNFSGSHELLKLFRRSRPREFHVTEELLLAAVGDNMYRTKAVEVILQDATADGKKELNITENVLLGASRSQYLCFDQGYMDLLLQHRPSGVSITTRMLELAARRDAWPGLGTFFHLLKHGDKSLVTQSVLLAAAQNNIDSSKRIFFKTLEDYNLEITQEIVAAAAANNGNGLLLGDIHHMVSERLSEEVLVAGMKNEAQAKILLNLEGERITITEKVVEAAVRGKSPKSVVECLLQRHGHRFGINENIAKYAVEHPSEGLSTIKLLLKERGDEITITEGILKSIAERPDEGSKILELLLRERRIEVENNVSEAILVAAASSGQLHVLRILSDIKPEIKLDPSLHEICKFQHAARQGYVATVKDMLKEGFEPDVRSTSGFTPLWIAAYKNRERMVAVLLRTGKVDINVQDSSGRTPVMVSIAHPYHFIVRRLLQARADCNIEDKNGHDAFWWSLEHSSKGMYPLPVHKKPRDQWNCM